MAYPLSAATLEWQRKARAYAEEELIPYEEEAEFHEGVVSPEVAARQKRLGLELGLSRIDAPISQGGLALPLLDQVVIWEQLGRVTNALCWSVPEAHAWMFEACSADQIERYVRPMMAGKRRECYAITEAESGSDPNAIATTATLENGEYVITGEKWFVTSANKADFLFLQAVVQDPAGEGQHALFFVDKDTPGIEMTDNPLFGHTYSSHHPTYRFEGVRVPEANRIGQPGEGMGFTQSWFRRERLMIAARCCGAAARLIEMATDFAQKRVVSGQPIAQYQLIQAMLADSLTELWGARLMTYEAAAMQDRGEPLPLVHTHCSMAKLTASEMANRVADRVVQIFGGRGYLRSNAAQRFYRELRVDRIWEGTSEIQRLIIARSLLKRGVDTLIG
ncbi:MAG: acyl-CoA dehydrogenase family protein [Burkholderiaceae bacterium]|jgi:alkylation response protein AidB-like acyl-CoA dehydrogenase